MHMLRFINFTELYYVPDHNVLKSEVAFVIGSDWIIILLSGSQIS